MKRPTERMTFPTIPALDKSLDTIHQRLGGRKATTAKDVSLQDRKENLDLIDPGRMDRRVVKHEDAVLCGIELRLTLVFAVIVDIEVIPDDMDLLRALIRVSHCVHEGYEIVRCVRRVTSADYVSRCNVQRRQHRYRTVTFGFVLVLPWLPRTRQA